MGIPQVIMIAVMTANVTIGFIYHNKPRIDKYNVLDNSDWLRYRGGNFGSRRLLRLKKADDWRQLSEFC